MRHEPSAVRLVSYVMRLASCVACHARVGVRARDVPAQDPDVVF